MLQNLSVACLLILVALTVSVAANIYLPHNHHLVSTGFLLRSSAFAGCLFLSLAISAWAGWSHIGRVALILIFSGVVANVLSTILLSGCVNLVSSDPFAPLRVFGPPGFLFSPGDLLIGAGATLLPLALFNEAWRIYSPRPPK